MKLHHSKIRDERRKHLMVLMVLMAQNVKTRNGHKNITLKTVALLS